MGDSTIANLPTAGSVNNTDIVPIDQGGVTRKATLLQISVAASSVALQNHLADMVNPHQTTKTQVGLGNVDNTSDANKPVSTAQATALGLKEDDANKSTSVVTDQASNIKFPSVKAVYDWAMGLLNLKAPLDSPTFTTSVVVPVATTATQAVTRGQVSGPSFSARQSTLQSIPNATPTKVSLQSEEWDTASAFDSTTNYRFQPSVAGYYQINGCCGIATTTIVQCYIYKNGSIWKSGPLSLSTSSNSVNAQVYLNGSSDYVELYVYQGSGGAANSSAVASVTFMDGAMVRLS